MKKQPDEQQGERIRTLREKLGLSREQLADLADISSKFLYDIEVGNKGFSAQTLSQLVISLQTSADYILFGNVNCKTIDDLSYIMRNLPAQKQKQLISIFSIICTIAQE